MVLGMGGTVPQWVALRQGLRFDSQLGSLSAQSLHILPMSAWVSSGCSGFFPHSKDVRVRWIGHAKLPLSVRGISRVNAWGCGDGAWVGLWSVLTQWAEWPPSALYDYNSLLQEPLSSMYSVEPQQGGKIHLRFQGSTKGKCSSEHHFGVGINRNFRAMRCK